MKLQTIDKSHNEPASELGAQRVSQEASVAPWSRFLTACHPETGTELSQAQSSHLAIENPLLLRRQALLNPRHPWNRLRRYSWIAFYGDEGAASRYADALEALAFLYNAGMPLAEALEHCAPAWDHEAGRAFRQAARLMRQSLTLSGALSHSAASLPAIVVPVLQVGERDGFQEAALKRLVAGLRYQVAVEHGFDYALGYGLARLLDWIRRLVSNRPLPAALDTKKLSLPGAGPASRCLATGRWTRTFALLWHCGVPVSQALETAAETAGNAFYAHLLRQAAARTRAGCTLSASLAEARLLPPHLLEVISTAETSGDLGPALDRFANLADDDGREAAGKTAFALFFGSLLFPAALAAILAVLYWMLVSGRR